MPPAIDIHNLKGLSATAAAERLRLEGFNELPSSKPRSIFAIAWEVVREPMFLMLVACGAIYLALGDAEEALMLMGFVFVVMGITLYQERKTERALEALRDLSSPRASVIRDGQQTRIAGREVVRGDLLLLREGDRVPADAILLHTTNLSVDESLLTGESVPVRKQAMDTLIAPRGGAPTESAASTSSMKRGSATPWRDSAGSMRPGGDDTPGLFSGTLVVQGQGVAEVRAIGGQTELGRIGKALLQVEPEDTLLQKETRRVVKRLAVVGLSLCGAVIILYALPHMAADGARKAWLDGVLAGITLAMAMLPEEFPVVLTIFLALGAWRISRQHVLTRRIPAIETLGAATVLCTDKTGTLTLNRMTVARLTVAEGSCELGSPAPASLPEPFHALVEYGVLASQRDPFDPMEKAIHDVGRTALAETEHLHDNWELVREYPLSRELLALSHVWKSRAGDAYVIAAKGAPEAIADLCHFTPEQTRALAAQIDVLAADGLRVLGVARAHFNQQGELPGQQHDFPFAFIGLLGLADPVRPTVPEAIRECHAAGIRVVMITGDYPGTARNIARQICLPPGELLTGPELDALDDAALRQRISRVNVFARVVPEQKLRIVEALKANGEIVAMTGDGVNDAPALKAANIGIAMGARGTDVARESASLVLLDDDFASIVKAIRLGRRIFDNIRKAIAYIFAIHVPIAGMSLLPVLLGWPLVLLPVHILFLELIIDPACSTIFEAEKEEADIMQRPPRDPREPLFSARSVWSSVLQGLSVLAIVVGVFASAWYLDRGEPEARALAYTTLIVANLGLILTNRSHTRTILATLRTPNAAVWWVLGGATVFLTLVLTVPGLRSIFKFAPLHAPDIGICLIAGVLAIAGFEVAKRFRHGKSH
ncbi:MAG: cation-translocating P-type ATPase [bacterium]